MKTLLETSLPDDEPRSSANEGAADGADDGAKPPLLSSVGGWAEGLDDPRLFGPGLPGADDCDLESLPEIGVPLTAPTQAELAWLNQRLSQHIDSAGPWSPDQVPQRPPGNGHQQVHPQATDPYLHRDQPHTPRHQVQGEQPQIINPQLILPRAPNGLTDVQLFTQSQTDPTGANWPPQYYPGVGRWTTPQAQAPFQPYRQQPQTIDPQVLVSDAFNRSSADAQFNIGDVKSRDFRRNAEPSVFLPPGDLSDVLSAEWSTQLTPLLKEHEFFHDLEQPVGTLQNAHQGTEQNVTMQTAPAVNHSLASANDNQQWNQINWGNAFINLDQLHTPAPGSSVIPTSLMSNQLSGTDAEQLSLTPDTLYEITGAGTAINALASNTLSQPNPHVRRISSGRKQQRIGPEAKSILLEAFEQDPYPSTQTLEALAQKTDLDFKKVRTWFRNTRARRHPEPEGGSKRVSGELYGQPTESRLSKESLERLSLEIPPNYSTPISSYMSSPVSLEDDQSRSPATPEASQSPGSSRFRSRASSIQSSQLGSSAASVSGSVSVSSAGSNASPHCRSRRKGRKRHANTSSSPYHRNNRPAGAADALSAGPSEPHSRKYFCTFCGDSFKGQYEWKRHEETKHIPRTTWVCCPELEYLICPFCGHLSPDQAHLNVHGYQRCASQTEESRTFLRRDNFVQHLHNSHYPGIEHPDRHAGCTLDSADGCRVLLSKWQRSAPPLAPGDPALHCGFCGLWMNTWEERVQHVGNHFSSRTPCEPDWWWPERMPMALQRIEIPNGMLTKRCRYCSRLFAVEDTSHTRCEIWSCRFIKQRPTSVWRGTHYCDQEFFASFLDFVVHVLEVHGTQIAMNRKLYQPSFCKTQFAVFEPAGPVGTSTIPSGNPPIPLAPTATAIPSTNYANAHARPHLPRRHTNAPEYRAPHFALISRPSSRFPRLCYLKGGKSASRTTPVPAGCTSASVIVKGKGHLATLALTGGLVGMSGAGMTVGVRPSTVLDGENDGWIEFDAGDEEDGSRDDEDDDDEDEGGGGYL